MFYFVLAVQTPNNRRRNIPRSGKRAMSHILSVLAHHTPLDRKHVSLFIFRKRRMTSSADRSTASRRQRHTGRKFAQAEEQEGGNENQADSESWGKSEILPLLAPRNEIMVQKY